MLLTVALTSLLICSSLFYFLEHGENPRVSNLWDAVWWWFVTSTTVGYGDTVAVTTAGRIVSIFAIVTGFFVFANSVAMIAESVHCHLERYTLGRADVYAKNHVVICEYTAVADELIQSLPQSVNLKDREVVIVSDMVERNPYPRYHFVHGVPISPAILKKANIEKADYVFIFANMRFADPDVKTMHIASRVLKLNPQARVFVELIHPDSDLTENAPAGLVVMDSRKLIRDVLRGNGVNADTLQEKLS